MKNNSSFNNNALCLTQSKCIPNDNDKFFHLSYNSQTLNIIRSIVDELYEINKEEVLSRNDSNEKRVRFTLEQEETDRTEITVKSQPILSKVDCSISTNDLPSRQCECATQTMDTTIPPEYSTKSTSILNHSLYSCENSNILSSSSTAQQLIAPSEGKYYDICQEQTVENYNIFSDDHMIGCNSSVYVENLTKLNDHGSLPESNEKLSDETVAETNTKLCTCSKRNLSDIDFPRNKFAFADQGRLLEELHLSPQSLQSMYDDGLVYIHDLVLVFLRNIPQFYQILVKHYYVPKRQANLFVKILQKWWKKQQY